MVHYPCASWQLLQGWCSLRLLNACQACLPILKPASESTAAPGARRRDVSQDMRHTYAISEARLTSLETQPSRRLQTNMPKCCCRCKSRALQCLPTGWVASTLIDASRPTSCGIRCTSAVGLLLLQQHISALHGKPIEHCLLLEGKLLLGIPVG